MVGDLHGMIILFVDLASTYSYNEAVKKDQPISAQAYADALYHARTHVLRLRTVFASGDLGEYRDIPPLMTLLSINTDSDGTQGSTTPIKQDPPRRPRQVITPDEPPSGRRNALRAPAGRPEPRQAPNFTADQITDLKAKGIVTFRGRGRPPRR
jgi:hypothetical protein